MDSLLLPGSISYSSRFGFGSSRGCRLATKLASRLLIMGFVAWASLARGQALPPAPIPGLPLWTWQVGQPTGYPLLAQHVFDDLTMIAVGGHGTAIKTSNGGSSWQVLPTGVDRGLTSVSFADAQNGWAGSETLPVAPLHYLAGAGQVLHSTNGGQSWTPQALGDNNSVVNPNVVAVSPTEAYVAYYQTGRYPPLPSFSLPQVPMLRHTTNGGQSWSLLSQALLPTSTYVDDMVFPTAATGYIVMGSNFAGGLRRTTDHGLSWQNVEPSATNGGVAGFRPERISFLDAQNGWVVGGLASGGDALFRTSDGGQSWTALTVPYPYAGYGLSFADAQHGIVMTLGARYVTADGGQTWAGVSVPFSLLYSQPMRLLPSGAGWSVGSGGGVFASTDFGQSWESRAALPGGILALGFPDPIHGWTVPYTSDRNGQQASPPVVLRTTRRGTPWQRQDLTAVVGPTGRLLGGAFPDADTAWVSGDYSSPYAGLVLRTTDGGQSWRPQSLPLIPPNSSGGTYVPSITTMAAWDTRRAMAVNNLGHVYVTHSGGQQWLGPTMLLGGRRRLYQATWADSATVYLTTDTLVFLKSVNAGRSWQQLPVPGNSTLYSSQRMTFTSAVVGYLMDNTNIWKTTNGGISWTRTDVTALSSPLRPPYGGQKQAGLLNASFRTGQKGWAFGSTDVLQTMDAGQTWTHVAYIEAGGASGGPGVLLDRYNAFSSGSGLVRYSEKFVQADTALARLTYCAGEALSLPFTTEGSFAGEDNFLVQLSNRMGRFRPGETRVVGSGHSSPLAVTLPADLAAGSHYRLRVIQRDSLVLGGDNGRDLLIEAVPPAPALALLPAGPLQATLPTGSAAPDHYEWERDSLPVVGQSGTQLTSPATGTYRVRACSAACCGPWSAVVAVVPDLVVSSAQNIQGTYNHVTVTGPATGGAGVATLSGPLTVLGSLTVQAGGTLLTSCQPLTGGGSFGLAADATLSICDPAGIAASGAVGAVQLSGPRSFSPDASYSYDGAQAQVTGSGLPAQVRNLTVDNGGAGLTQTQDVAVAQVLRLTAGNLRPGPHAFTLLSGPAGTALIDNTGGVVSGTGTMQRYLDNQNPAGRGYRHYSSPVSNTTFADLGGTGYTPELGAGYNTSPTPGLVTPFPTLFGYDQSRLGTASNNFLPFDKGWYVPAALTAAMPVGQGFTANVPNAALVDFTGTFTSGPVTRPGLGRGPQAAAGWQLLGNPYPSPLDWSSVAPAQRPGLDAAVHVFESTGVYAGNYRSYVNGFGNPLIVAGSGFFARVTTAGAAATLTLTNANRLTTFGAQPAFGRGPADGRPQLHLLVHGSGSTDETYLYLEAGATAGVDVAYDATKLPNSTGLNMALLSGSEVLSINGLPILGNAEVIIPLTLEVPQAGQFRFEVAELANFGTTVVYLRDALANTQQALAAQTHYAFTLPTPTAGQGRFSLVLRPSGALATAAALTAASVCLYPNPAHGSCWLALPPLHGTSRVQATLLNAVGQVVRSFSIPLGAVGATVALDVRDLAAGVYALRLESVGQQYTQRVVLE